MTTLPSFFIVALDHNAIAYSWHTTTDQAHIAKLFTKWVKEDEVKSVTLYCNSEMLCEYRK